MKQNYEEFKELVEAEFLKFMPEKYQDMEISIRKCNKVNTSRDGLSLMSKDSGMNISPTIYIDDMFKDYERTGDIREVLTKAAALFEEAMEHAGELVPAVDYDNAKDNVVFQLINTEQNREMLNNMPSREFKDLSIVYRWVIKADSPEGIHSAMIDNLLAAKLGMTEDELFKCAVQNTKRIFPPVVKNMNDVIREMFVKDGMPIEVAEMMTQEIPDDKSMWVISNAQGINGAVSMLYEDNLHELAMKLDSDLYIMPSSVHEVIAVSSNLGDPNELAAMVVEVNMQEVELAERLSNQVYHYDKDLRKLDLATDTPNKRLDGIVAEQSLVYSSQEKSR